MVGTDHQHQADAAVEGPPHLGIGDAAGLLQPLENGRQGPGVPVKLSLQPIG